MLTNTAEKQRKTRETKKQKQKRKRDTLNLYEHSQKMYLIQEL